MFFFQKEQVEDKTYYEFLLLSYILKYSHIRLNLNHTFLSYNAQLLQTLTKTITFQDTNPIQHIYQSTVLFGCSHTLVLKFPSLKL